MWKRHANLCPLYFSPLGRITKFEMFVICRRTTRKYCSRHWKHGSFLCWEGNKESLFLFSILFLTPILRMGEFELWIIAEKTVYFPLDCPCRDKNPLCFNCMLFVIKPRKKLSREYHMYYLFVDVLSETDTLIAQLYLLRLFTYAHYMSKF